MTSSSTGDAGTPPDLYALTSGLGPDELIALGPELRASIPPDCLLATLDITPTHVGRARARAAMTVNRQHLNQRGIAQAGALIAFADATAGWASYSALASGRFTTLDLSANLLGAAREGDRLVADARPIHAGRTTQVFDVEITRVQVPGAAGAVIARVTCTQLILADRGLKP